MVGTLVGMTRRSAAVIVLAGLLLTACSAEETPVGDAASSPSPSVTSTEPPEETATEKTSVVVPDVVGMDGASALAELEAAGLGAAAFWQNSELTPDGQLDVSVQEPRAGETLLAGDDVVLALDVPHVPDTVVLQSGDAFTVVVGAGVDERQVGWIVTDLMDPDRTPYRLDVVEADRPPGTYSVVVRCEGAPSPEESVVAEATFTVDADTAQTGSRRTADEITMIDGASCG